LKQANERREALLSDLRAKVGGSAFVIACGFFQGNKDYPTFEKT